MELASAILGKDATGKSASHDREKIKTMDLSTLFEAFVVFYALECLVLISTAVWYYSGTNHDSFSVPQQEEKKILQDPWGDWKEEK